MKRWIETLICLAAGLAVGSLLLSLAIRKTPTSQPQPAPPRFYSKWALFDDSSFVSYRPLAIERCSTPVPRRGTSSSEQSAPRCATYLLPDPER